MMLWWAHKFSRGTVLASLYSLYVLDGVEVTTPETLPFVNLSTADFDRQGETGHGLPVNGVFFIAVNWCKLLRWSLFVSILLVTRSLGRVLLLTGGTTTRKGAPLSSTYPGL
jgi:hypothetical protein